MANDVAADANPSTGAAVYDTFGFGGWLVDGGTSLSTPLIAGVFALSGNATSQHGGQTFWENKHEKNPISITLPAEIMVRVVRVISVPTGRTSTKTTADQPGGARQTALAPSKMIVTMTRT